MSHELPRRSEDDTMRRFRVDCRTCQGAGAGCPTCGNRGTVIIELDESDQSCAEFDAEDEVTP